MQNFLNIIKSCHLVLEDFYFGGNELCILRFAAGNQDKFLEKLCFITRRYGILGACHSKSSQ